MNENHPFLSICIVAYNHEKYIRTCLNSVLTQKVDFAIEILVGNDCSRDKTADIIKNEYGKRVSLIDRKENIGLCANLLDLFMQARGKYVYPFSGDDFFLVDYAFQKQVDFLERNPEYFSVSARNSTFIESTKEFKKATGLFGEYTILDFLRKGNVPCVLGTMRNIFRMEYPNNIFLQKGAKNNEEIKYWVYTLDHGKKYIFKEEMTTYRLVEKGGNNYNSTRSLIERTRDYLEDLKVVEKKYGNQYNFKPYRMMLLNNHCLHMSRKCKDLLRFMYVLSVKDKMELILYKIYLKFHRYQNPDSWTKTEYLIKKTTI